MMMSRGDACAASHASCGRRSGLGGVGVVKSNTISATLAHAGMTQRRIQTVDAIKKALGNKPTVVKDVDDMTDHGSGMVQIELQAATQRVIIKKNNGVDELWRESWGVQ